jgi:small subunit ribosomal protein S4e
MAKKGVRKHQKRLSAPKHWMLSKVGGIWATKPSQGPHRLRECIPLNVVLRNKLKLALTGRESKMIVMAKDGNIAIDGKIRKDFKYPCGFMDVLTILKTKTNYRLLYDCKGRFGLNKISPSEAEYKLCRVKARAMGPKGIPYIVTHDGRTIRFPNPEIKANDTVRVNLRNGEITDFYKFAEGCQVMIKGGNNIGRTAVLQRVEKHEGSYDIVYCKDPNNKEFSTRMDNVFVIGKTKPEITLMRNHNRQTIIEERTAVRGKRMNAVEVDDEVFENDA